MERTWPRDGRSNVFCEPTEIGRGVHGEVWCDVELFEDLPQTVVLGGVIVS
jgi:hypothetical protein